MSGNLGPFEIVMIRHGESEWNQKNHFCGWFDANLSEKGRDEAVAAGKFLKAEGYEFDVAHTSVLRRAQNTLNLVLQEIGQSDIPIFKSWRLNERHFGGLTGLSEAETGAKYGKIQTLRGRLYLRIKEENIYPFKLMRILSYLCSDELEIWSRSFHAPSPPMVKDHPYYETIVNDSRYALDLTPAAIPMCESLDRTIERTLQYWNEVIVPQIKEGKRAIISAHSNSLRGIVKHLDDISDAGIMELNIPSGIPFLYELDTNMKPINQVTYLGNRETVRKAMADALAQGTK